MVENAGSLASAEVPGASILAVEGLTFGYGNKDILRGLELAIPKGEIFGLLGPNGVGKTTFVRTICGRIKPRSGSVLICGRANTSKSALRRVGLVPQDIALYPHLTARENLETFGRLSGLTRRQTDEALSFAIEGAKLGSHLDVPVHRLSGGWKRRVNIAASVLHKPSLLILDEPTVGVDIDARNALQNVIRDLSRSGLAVLLSTHDLDQAQSLCARVGFLRDGVLSPVGNPVRLLQQAFGDKREIVLELRQPASPSEQDFLKSLTFFGNSAGLEWRGMINGSDRQQAGLHRELRQSKLSIKEIRYHEPGLDSLFLSLNAGGAGR